jgi:uroporphyrin-III C-methyltransferase/precorrin-2 dehydrogenase/sirohydrochlorin ferrochelatase
MYPVMLQVAGRDCLVVGGGGVALRKVEGLLSDGARITVVALKPVAGLAELAQKNTIKLKRRAYCPGEAKNYALVFAATDDRQVNRQVFEDASLANLWVNVADDPELCNFHLPARIKRGQMQIAIASAGEAPFVVRRLRQFLENRFGLEWAAWIDAAARFRQRVRSLNLSKADQEASYNKFFKTTVDQEKIAARVPTETEEQSFLPVGAKEKSHTKTYQTPNLSKNTGLVSLVGGGPGDFGLLTLRGYQRLMAADAVVYDHLAETALPPNLPADVELYSVGKKAGHHAVPQDEINGLIVRLANQGKRVVRLKGGDPFVFGRGGEEAEELVKAGVSFEVVPCVTAGVAVPAYAGIPVTYRKEVVRLTLVTAHESVKSQGTQVRWDLLAQDPHATLVGYMGVTSLPKVVDELLAAGMEPKTPAAIIERGTTPKQRTVTAQISKLPQAVKRENVRPPALFVIGPAVRHMEKLNWFSSRQLMGQRIVTIEPADELSEALELAGAQVVTIGLPPTPAARIVMGALPLTGCVFRSADQVEALDDERQSPGWSDEMTAYCTTEQAAQRARELGWSKVIRIDRDSNFW